MKNRNISIVLVFTLLTAVAIRLTGCSTTSMQRSEKATITMQTMDNDIKLVAVQLDATGSSLDELMRPAQTDIKKAFDLFSDNISKITAMQKQLANHADEMKERGKDYFEEWQKEGGKYKNAKIQELSEQRRNELSEIYGKIAQSNIGVRDTFKAYISDITEIKTYLMNDLTAKGIETILPISRKVVKDGEDLKYSIKTVQMAIDKARTEMSQGTK